LVTLIILDLEYFYAAKIQQILQTIYSNLLHKHTPIVSASKKNTLFFRFIVFFYYFCTKINIF